MYHYNKDVHEIMRRVVARMIEEGRTKVRKRPSMQATQPVGTREATYIQEESDRDFDSVYADQYGHLPAWE